MKYLKLYEEFEGSLTNHLKGRVDPTKTRVIMMKPVIRKDANDLTPEEAKLFIEDCLSKSNFNI